MTPDIALSPKTYPPEWEPPAPPTDLIFDDGVPLESNRHRIAMNVLIQSTQQALTPRTHDFFTGGNMFVYYSRNQAMNRDFRGPDFFVVLGVEGDRDRQGWVVWEEEGRYPDVIVELLSPSTAAVDKGVKKDLYEQVFKTSDYFVFDPFDPTSLQGWQLDAVYGYQPLSPNEQGWLWCESLGLWLGTWEGSINREPVNSTCHWLRLYDPSGNLIPLPEESAQQQAAEERQRAEQERLRAEQEKQRADRLAERLRKLGIDPSNL
ncbi:MAG: Uma2 family endonuclease [Leptolyngbyaceae bacterium]|nr:Uma2 family endonuclease [Leptolyngbyaceae bacterium]